MPAIGKSKAKTYSKENTTKKDPKYVADNRPGRTPKRKKVYTGSKLSDAQAKAKKSMTSNKAYTAPTFDQAFAAATKANKSKFMVGGKSYLTTKGKREKRFDPTKIKGAPTKKGNVFTRFATKLRGGHETQKGYEEARDKRRKEKRIASIEKRKEEGKSYSSKNLASLKGSSKSKPTWITRKSDTKKKS